MRQRLDAVVIHLVLGELKAPATKEGTRKHVIFVYSNYRCMIFSP